jgi:hypothetical protein
MIERTKGDNDPGVGPAHTGTTRGEEADKSS